MHVEVERLPIVNDIPVWKSQAAAYVGLEAGHVDPILLIERQAEKGSMIVIEIFPPDILIIESLGKMIHERVVGTFMAVAESGFKGVWWGL